MNLLIALAVDLAFVQIFGQQLKKRPALFYGVFTLFSLAIVAVSYGGYESSLAPPLLPVWNMLFKCSFASGFFLFVMFAGAAPRGHLIQKKLMPLRAELSVLACILTFGHNIAFGRHYFVLLFTDRTRLSATAAAASICSLLMLLLLLPLFFTSFRVIRRRMQPKRWKQLQRLAYVFYALLYTHILLVYLPLARGGSTEALVNVLLYTVVYAAYAVLRLGKAIKIHHYYMRRLLLVSVGLPAMLIFSAATQGYIAANATVAPATEWKKDGVYQGVGKGYQGEITVQVTVTDGKLTQITVLEADDDAPYFSAACKMLDTIIAQQSTEVDVVSGASISSRGLRSAVRDALSQAE